MEWFGMPNDLHEGTEAFRGFTTELTTFPSLSDFYQENSHIIVDFNDYTKLTDSVNTFHPTQRPLFMCVCQFYNERREHAWMLYNPMFQIETSFTFSYSYKSIAIQIN
jgi:hypothetical protein